MSRLPVALGIAPMGAGRRAATKQQQAFEQDNGTLSEKAHIIYREYVDASLQGGDLTAGVVMCWHPVHPILAVATTTAVVEYDALSGCRRNYVESSGSPAQLHYTPDGSHILLLTKERNITAWSTTTWRRRSLLTAEARYANRPLVTGLLAIASGPNPIIYYAPMGKMTLRTVHMSLPDPASSKGGRIEKEFVPGFKLKTENKKPLVGLTAHPSDRQTLFALLLDGTLAVCNAQPGGTLTIRSGLPVPFDAKAERVRLHAIPHPIHPGAALILVEAERSGLTVLVASQRIDLQILTSLPIGAGGTLAGAGVLHKSCLLVAAVRHAGGNVGIHSWRLLPDSRSLTPLPVSVYPNTVWDALQGPTAADASSLADVSGEALLAGMALHGPSSLLAFWTSRQEDSGAAHLRFPLLAVVEGEDPLEGLGAARCLPLHTAPSFWTTGAGPDGVVSKLHFPRYAYLVNLGRVLSYDLTHGLAAECLAPPAINGDGQERVLTRAIYSSKRSLWLAFMRVLSMRDGSFLGPGQYEFTAAQEAEAAVAAGAWSMPGRDATFVGGRDELTAVLSNSGTLIAVFETSKLSQAGARATYVVEMKEDGGALRLLPGPPSHIPAAPMPRPEMPQKGEEDNDQGDETDEEAEAAMQEWEAAEARRLDLPKRMLVLTPMNRLRLTDVSQGSLSSYHGAQSRSLASKHSLQLHPSETIIQVAWQTLVDPSAGFHAGEDGADTALPCVAAIVTSERVLLANHRLELLLSVLFAGDVGAPVSALWLGPALLVSTSGNQVMHVRWDGRVDHVASLLSGPPVALLAALADRLVVVSRGKGPGLMSGRAEGASRGFAVLPPMLLGWAGVAAQGWLPGGAGRARKEMRTLLASYDASKLPVAVLDALAVGGFADVAAAAAARSELSSVTPARRAALAAAAGDWKPVVQLLESELAGSEWHPQHPPRGSLLYNKVVALARVCELHGRFTQARALFEEVGAWNELLALCIFQGDFAAVQSYARQGGRDVEALADQLLAVNENTFRRVSTGALYGGRPNADDWLVDFDLGLDEKSPAARGAVVGEDVENGPPSHTGAGDVDDDDGAGAAALIEFDTDVAPAGRLPFMEASLRVSLAAAASGALPADLTRPPPQTDSREADDDANQPIPPLDLSTLEAYLGVHGATILKDAVATAAVEVSLPGGMGTLGRTDTATSSEFAAQVAGGPRGQPQPSDTGSLADSEADAAAVVSAAKGLTPAQSAARAAYQRESTRDEDDFFSSDEESNDAESRSAASFAASTSNRFLFKIRQPGETPQDGGGGSTAAGSNAAALRAAALSLKLGRPSTTAASLSGAEAAGLSKPTGTTPPQTARSDISSMSSMDMHLPAVPSLPAYAIPTPPPAAPLVSLDPQETASAAEGQTTEEGPAPAGKNEPIVSKDPFADIPGLPPTLAQASSSKAGAGTEATTQPAPGTKVGAPLPSEHFTSEGAGAPMRPQAAPVVPQSDLLSGWDDFEALFSGGGGASVSKPPQHAVSTAQRPALVASPVVLPLPAPQRQSPVTAVAAPAPSPARSSVPPTTGPVDPPAAVRKPYKAAMDAFHRGLWGMAADRLADCISAKAVNTAKDGSLTATFRQQCVAQYSATTLVARASAAPPAAASRLARFAVAVPVAGSPQRAILTAFAVEANMAAGNYGWAADQLTWLLVAASEGEVGGYGLDPGSLQEKLTACDAAGATNASLPQDEDVESFAGIVGSCTSRQEVDDMIANLMQV